MSIRNTEQQNSTIASQIQQLVIQAELGNLINETNAKLWLSNA